MAGTCWLIVDRHGQSPLIVGQFARLRGLQVRLAQSMDDFFARAGAPPNRLLVAAGANGLEALSEPQRHRLCSLIRSGATLYVRGGFKAGGGAFKLLFAEHQFTLGPETHASAPRLSRDSLLPSALEDEAAECEFQALGAHYANGSLQNLLSASFGGGERRAVVFAMRAGTGVVIYDLQPVDGAQDDGQPLLMRLAQPDGRCSCVGALAAVDRAWGRDPKRPAAFNLTIDDRPTNYDYFNLFALRTLLEYAERKCPGTHIDFAWVPSQTHPSSRYVSLLKQFNAGFLWHGLCRHVDHRTLENPAADLAAGKRLVGEICRRYGVRFQPVMIFPYERSSRASLDLIEREGFVACAQSHERIPEADQEEPEYLRGSMSGHLGRTGGFVTLFRYLVPFFTRGTLLARAALGLPIMAAAHPSDLGLRRFSGLSKNSGSASHFGPILDFAAAKGLRPCSVEQIAREMVEESAPVVRPASASA